MSANPTSIYQTPYFVGVDVGGTNIKIGIVDDHGQTIAETKFPTQPDKTPRLAFEQAKREIAQLIGQHQLSWDDINAVGLGTPGPLDTQSGMILTPVNLPGWHHFPVRDELENKVGKPVTYSNDACAAAYGEFWMGSGRQFSSIVLITLGTGVGGGIIVNDQSIDGAHSHGAEVGHILIETGPEARMCGCGQRGHLEAYASATALVERTREAMAKNRSPESPTTLKDRISDDSPLSALMISQAASAGDPFAGKMIDQTAAYLGSGIAQLANVIDPEVFILGGAMNFGGSDSELGRKFLSDVEAATRKLVFPVLAEKLIVKFALLEGSAGFIGAAGLARLATRKK